MDVRFANFWFRAGLGGLIMAAVLLPRHFGACCQPQEQAKKPVSSCCTRTHQAPTAPRHASCAENHADCVCACCDAAVPTNVQERSARIAASEWALAPAVDSTLDGLRTAGSPQFSYLTDSSSRCEIPHRILHCSWII